MFIYILKRCLPLGVTLHPKQYSPGDNQKIKKWDKIERRRMSPSVWTHNGRWNMPDEGRTRQHTHTHTQWIFGSVRIIQATFHSRRQWDPTLFYTRESIVLDHDNERHELVVWQWHDISYQTCTNWLNHSWCIYRCNWGTLTQRKKTRKRTITRRGWDMWIYVCVLV